MITHNNLVCYFFFYSSAALSHIYNRTLSSPVFWASLYLWEGDEISVGLLVRDAAVTNLHVGFLDVSLKLLGVSHV